VSVPTCCLDDVYSVAPCLTALPAYLAFPLGYEKAAAAMALMGASDASLSLCGVSTMGLEACLCLYFYVEVKVGLRCVCSDAACSPGSCRVEGLA
jgi:hypothetical protein